MSHQAPRGRNNQPPGQPPPNPEDQQELQVQGQYGAQGQYPPQGQYGAPYGGYPQDYPGQPQYGYQQPLYGQPPQGPTQGPPRKKHGLRKWLIIASAVFAGIIAAIVAVGIAAGNAANHAANPVAAQPSFTPNTQTFDTSTPTPTPTGPDMLSVGQSETVANASTNTTEATITVESVNVTTQPAQSFGESPANGYFVVVEAKATAASTYTGGFDINEFDFYDLVNGSHYSSGNGNAFSGLSDSQSNEDITSTLAAGETSSGWFAFDVPSRHGYIVYAPNLNGQPIAEWKY